MGTYHILVPHDVEEGVEGEVVVSPCEAGDRSEDGSSDENAVQVLLKTSELLFYH